MNFVNQLELLSSAGYHQNNVELASSEECEPVTRWFSFGVTLSISLITLTIFISVLKQGLLK